MSSRRPGRQARRPGRERPPAGHRKKPRQATCALTGLAAAALAPAAALASGPLPSGTRERMPKPSFTAPPPAACLAGRSPSSRSVPRSSPPPCRCSRTGHWRRATRGRQPRLNLRPRLAPRATASGPAPAHTQSPTWAPSADESLMPGHRLSAGHSDSRDSLQQ